VAKRWIRISNIVPAVEGEYKRGFRVQGFNVLPLASCDWLLASNQEQAASSQRPEARSKFRIMEVTQNL